MDFAIFRTVMQADCANLAQVLEMVHVKIPDLLPKKERTNVRLNVKVSNNIRYQ